MVTPELLEYVRTEISKGKTREEIHTALISGGGWNETDLSEAFRIVIPMQEVSFSEEKPIEHVIHPASSPPLIWPSIPPIISPFKTVSSSPHPALSFWFSSLKFLIILIILGGLGFGAWYYRLPIIGFWNSSVSNLKKIQLPSFNFSFLNKSKDVVPSTPTSIVPSVIQVKDCGIGVIPKLDNPSAYKNDPILFCLGVSAFNCENAKGILKDDFFPTIFEIIKLQDSCNFKLSYGEDSALVDITDKKLAGQYIFCPLNIVKAIDNTNPAITRFIFPDKTDLSKYASQIYFYGTLGLFVENNLEKNKIQALGCSGDYVDSVIASYQEIQSKK